MIRNVKKAKKRAQDFHDKISHLTKKRTITTDDIEKYFKIKDNSEYGEVYPKKRF